MISYDYQQNKIDMRFKDYQQLIDANGTHELTIVLLDQDDNSKEYKMNVTFSRQQFNVTQESAIKEFKVIEEEQNVFAKIKSFDQYGELIIEFSEIM